MKHMNTNTMKHNITVPEFIVKRKTKLLCFDPLLIIYLNLTVTPIHDDGSQCVIHDHYYKMAET